MTVLVTLQHARLSDVVTVSGRAAQVGESSIDLRPGERLTIHDLVEAALIQSANDAAVALAEYVGGSQARFVAMMNAEARKLGLRDTHFANPDGLDAPGHYSSAQDVTRLARIAMRSKVIRSVVGRATATIAGGRTLYTWNDLLSRFPGLFGVKTGHTGAAGWSEVAAARANGVTIYATLRGTGRWIWSHGTGCTQRRRRPTGGRHSPSLPRCRLAGSSGSTGHSSSGWSLRL
jgi:D-alanyl-D-alanine carboxypeptidase (penicillin-binding protein 5/6)